MILKKEYLKKEQLCRVTFQMANGNGLYARDIKIIGEFNNWDLDTKPMNKPRDGIFTQVLELEVNQEHQFRYLVDDLFWENEPEADDLVPSGIDEEDYNSVIVL